MGDNPERRQGDMSEIKRVVLETVNKARRRTAQLFDQMCVLICACIRKTSAVEYGKSNRGVVMIVVNFNTLHYLKMMLLSLCGQTAVNRIRAIIIIDNASRDGSCHFLQKLRESGLRIYIVQRRRESSHARNLRKGIQELRKMEKSGAIEPHDTYLIIDPDVLFLRKETLAEAVNAFERQQAALLGEMRTGNYEIPEAQASFLLIRAHAYHARQTHPFVNHGAPALWLQRSLRSQGFRLCDFPLNKNGYILHRGRSAVERTRRYSKLHAYATVTRANPHYMGLPDGAAVWRKRENEYAPLLTEANERALLAVLENCFAKP